jgi:LysR family transcriptional regulator for bpeEF and oprC
LIQVPGILVDRYLRDGTLEEVLTAFRPAPRPVSLVYPSRSHVAPPLRAFSDWLQQHFPAIDRTWLE